MIDAAPPPSCDCTPSDPAEARRAQELRLLEELTDTAMALARAFQAKALAVLETAESPEEHAVAVGHGRAFDRHARTLRQCLALKDRFLNGHAARQARAQTQAEAEEPAFLQIEPIPIVTPQQIVQRRVDVAAALRVAVHTADRTPVEREKLLADIDEFVCSDEDLAWGSISDILWRECIVLGLPHDPDLWADTAWAREEAATRTKFSPYLDDRPSGKAARPDPTLNDPMARPP